MRIFVTFVLKKIDAAKHQAIIDQLTCDYFMQNLCQANVGEDEAYFASPYLS